MATFVDMNLISGDEKIPADYGYHIVPIYTEYHISSEKKKWIENNLDGKWSSFTFGVPSMGQTYCFFNKSDAMAFKLRWS